jgi:hypothetical protein
MEQNVFAKLVQVLVIVCVADSNKHRALMIARYSTANLFRNFESVCIQNIRRFCLYTGNCIAANLHFCVQLQ